MLMLALSFFSWWYGPGWTAEVFRVKEQLLAVADTFSIELLFMTLFSPFRQISSGKADGPLGVIIRAWFDRMISRFIGALVRSFMIIIGCVSLLVLVVVGVIRLVTWPLLPALPVIFIVVSLTGRTL